MAKNEKNAHHTGEEPPIERQTRVRFLSSLAEKPQFFFPELNRVTAHWDTYGGWLYISPGFRNEIQTQIHRPEDYAVGLGVSDQAAQELAREFNIDDVSLLRIVLVIAIEQGQEAGERTLFWNGLRRGPRRADCEQLRQADRLSSELEQILREQMARASTDPQIDVLTQPPAVTRLLEALEEYGRLLSEFTVVEFENPSNKPPLYRARRIFAVLAPMWSRLTGMKPNDDKARFYKLFARTCTLAHIKPVPTDQSIYKWLKENYRE